MKPLFHSVLTKFNLIKLDFGGGLMKNIMKISLSLNIEDVDSENVEFELGCEEVGQNYFWTKIDKYPVGPEYSLEIQTDKELKNVISIQKGIHIINSKDEIKNLFLDTLFNLGIERQTDEADGIEHTHEASDNVNDEIIDPYDPKLIRVETKTFPIFQIYQMISNGDLDISPDFQRGFVWTDITRKSRLIESLLLRIPLPVFYVSQDSEGVFQVVDGVQRLTVIHTFMNNEFRLKNLEYIGECEGRWYNNIDKPDKSLSSNYIRRIEQTMLYFNIIDPQSPEKVRYDIFKRINTGGKALNNQEIRNCLSNKTTRAFLSKLSHSEEFLKATKGSISPTRMADQELVLRFIAFYIIDNKIAKRHEYRGGMNLLLDETISIMNHFDQKQFDEIASAFYLAMNNAYILFKEKAFRKASYINKSLFLSLSRALYKYKTSDIINKELGLSVLDALTNEINNNSLYYSALSMATNDARNINTTYETAKKVLEDYLE